MKTVYISVVSHAQEDMIISNFVSLPKQIGEWKVQLCLIDNTGSDQLSTYAMQNGHLYHYDGVRRGFGANHNLAFSVCSPLEEDIFIVCNPDIILDDEQLIAMVPSFVQSGADIGNVRCYYNKEKTILSNPDRHFPCFLNFVFSIALGKRFHYGSNYETESPEWISGEFMMVLPKAYRTIGGYDEDYFMYVEDVDFCYRARQAGLTIRHDPSHYVIHETQMASRSIVSKSFQLHLKSVMTYIGKHKRFCLLKMVS